MDLDKLGSLFESAMQQRESLEAEMDCIVVEASSGGGAVTVRMSGRHQVLKLTIAPAAASAAAADITMLEDLITAAVNEAARKVAAAIEAAGTKMLSSLDLPGK